MINSCAAIIIAAKHGELIKVKDASGITHTVGTLRCRFEFRTNDWDYTTRTAVFCKGNMTTQPSIIDTAIGVLLDNVDECAVPPEVLLPSEKYFSVGVWGVTKEGLRIVSKWLVFRIEDGCYVDSSESIMPTPSAYEQIMAQLSLKAPKEHEHSDKYYSKEDVDNKLQNFALDFNIPSKVSQLINDSGYISSIPDEYITEGELNSKGYLTEHQSLKDYAKKTDIPDLSELEQKVDDLDKTKLDESNLGQAVNTALAQAKASGEFDGESGADGKSAYEIAVEQGFKGSKNEWLESLKGEDGVIGKDGMSVTHKWDGTTLSITSASGTSSVDLKGEKGDVGSRGEAFTYEDFTEEQLALLKGEKGDSFTYDDMTEEQKADLLEEINGKIEADTIPIENSSKLITSGGVYDSLLSKLNFKNGYSFHQNDYKDNIGLYKIISRYEGDNLLYTSPHFLLVVEEVSPNYEYGVDVTHYTQYKFEASGIYIRHYVSNNADGNYIEKWTNWENILITMSENKEKNQYAQKQLEQLHYYGDKNREPNYPEDAFGFKLNSDGKSYGFYAKNLDAFLEHTDTMMTVIPYEYNGKPVTQINTDAYAYFMLDQVVYIPKSIKKIENNAFPSVVTDVYYGGSKTEWDQITIGTTGNDCITGIDIYPESGPPPATIHFATLDQKYVYEKLGDIEATLESIINKYGLGGEM